MPKICNVNREIYHSQKSDRSSPSVSLACGHGYGGGIFLLCAD